MKFLSKAINSIYLYIVNSQQKITHENLFNWSRSRDTETQHFLHEQLLGNSGEEKSRCTKAITVVTAMSETRKQRLWGRCQVSNMHYGI